MIGKGRERTGTPADLLVIGLGNPGSEYEHTRHNVGADVVALLATRHGTALKKAKEKALTAEVNIRGKRLALAFPQTYMNLSGESAQLLVRRYGVDDPARIVVVHDELDLPTGKLRLKAGGGLAGHNGLRSLKQHLHTDAFLRVRIGVGKPPRPEAGADHVLKKVSKSDREALAAAVEAAADAIEAIAIEGMDAAMNRFNQSAPPLT
ncbi:MAG: aminoacyl-tRNA hydrolase [Acidimicrobiia bacterium]